MYHLRTLLSEFSKIPLTFSVAVLQMQVCYSVLLYSVQTAASLNVTRRFNSICAACTLSIALDTHLQILIFFLLNN